MSNTIPLVKNYLHQIRLNTVLFRKKLIILFTNMTQELKPIGQ